uniref:Uncharacterized protein n=1 Tax=Anguilla anguilla TaxID=7936 RepID=A0A0E9RVF3_ANGAN
MCSSSGLVLRSSSDPQGKLARSAAIVWTAVVLFPFERTALPLFLCLSVYYCSDWEYSTR